MKMYSKDGLEMMDIQSFDRKADTLVLKGKMMGSMPAVVHVRPEDMWGAFKLTPWRLIVALPLMLLKGWLKSRKAPPVAKPAVK